MNRSRSLRSMVVGSDLFCRGAGEVGGSSGRRAKRCRTLASRRCWFRLSRSLLPLVELVIAAALVPASIASIAAIAAIALLGVFVIAIVVNLARGRRPDCNCFGQVHGTTIRRGPRRSRPRVDRTCCGGGRGRWREECAGLVAWARSRRPVRSGASAPRCWSRRSGCGTCSCGTGGCWCGWTGCRRTAEPTVDPDSGSVPGGYGLAVGSVAPAFEFAACSVR